ncbi:MAG: hypothetical protein COS37_02175 [Anaerolineae bacterium CG03_land_8_20_14_0_80_58_20]|nr:MAG: hypothetical protein COS37_02175 [Anaerolineae bacterium CG03_land_8_20_14_0_80_58_20]
MLLDPVKLIIMDGLKFNDRAGCCCWLAYIPICLQPGHNRRRCFVETLHLFSREWFWPAIYHEKPTRLNFARFMPSKPSVFGGRGSPNEMIGCYIEMHPSKDSHSHDRPDTVGNARQNFPQPDGTKICRGCPIGRNRLIRFRRLECNYVTRCLLLYQFPDRNQAS